MPITDFKKGSRVQMHPGTDLWMRGARYGDVVAVHRKYVVVQLDMLKKPIKVLPDNLIWMYDPVPERETA